MPWFNREFINALPKALSRFNKFGYRRQEKFGEFCSAWARYALLTLRLLFKLDNSLVKI